MIAEALALYLETQGFGTLGTNLFFGFYPDAPDSCSAVMDEPAGQPPDAYGFTVDRFGAMVIVRRPSYASARNDILAIHRAITGFDGELAVGHPTVIVIEPGPSPAPIGRDSDGRSEWTGHYTVVAVSTGDAFRQ